MGLRNEIRGIPPFRPGEDAYPGDAYVDFVGMDIQRSHPSDGNTMRPCRMEGPETWLPKRQAAFDYFPISTEAAQTPATVAMAPLSARSMQAFAGLSPEITFTPVILPPAAVHRTRVW